MLLEYRLLTPDWPGGCYVYFSVQTPQKDDSGSIFPIHHTPPFDL
jgi:hypothetical protein